MNQIYLIKDLYRHCTDQSQQALQAYVKLLHQKVKASYHWRWRCERRADPTYWRWRRGGAHSPRWRCRKKLQVAQRRRRTFKFIDCPPAPHYNIPQNLPTHQLSPSTTTATLLFISQFYHRTEAVSLFFIASYYCPLNFKCSAANFRCLHDLRGAVSKCFIEHK